MADMTTSTNYLTTGNATNDLAPKADLTYRLFENEVVTRGDLTRSLLIGTYFRNCRFEETKFDNCDIEGAHFAGCTFIGCTFVDADVRSCAFADCVLQDCRFDRALLQDLSAQRTSFQRVSFAKASVHDSAFSKSRMEECSLQNASVLHNRFSTTSFVQMRFADCTFLYPIFDECDFESVAINVEAIGVSFGLSMKNIESFDLVYLGDIQAGRPADLIAAFRSSYRERKWAFSEAMLNLNFGPSPRMVAINDALRVLLHVARAGVGVKRDEFRFVVRVANLLGDEGKLPLGFLSSALEKTGELLSAGEFVATSARNVVQELHNQLYLLMQQSIEAYQEVVADISSFGELTAPVQLTIRYSERPSNDSVSLIRLTESTEEECFAAELLDARYGSWIEIVQTTLGGLMALYAAAAVINGIQMQIIRGRALRAVAFGPIPKRMAQAIVRKTVLSREAVSISRSTQTALRLLAAHAKSSLAHAESPYIGAAMDLAKLESITVDQTSGEQGVSGA